MIISNKRFLVTGGAGFIGSHIVDQLLKEDVAEVLIYDNFSRGSLGNLKSALQDPRCKIFQYGGDILYRDLLDKATENIDGVFHLAALWLLHCQDYPKSAMEVNVNGTFNVIESCIKNKVKKIIFSSSASVYGDALEIPMTENHPYNNYTFYGATKIAGEHLFRSLGHRFDFDWLALRYMNVYGPRQDYKGAYTAVMHKILDRIELNLPPIIQGDGTQSYDFIAVEDIARANILAMKSSYSKEFINIGTGVPTSLNSMAETLLRLKNSNLTVEYDKSGFSFVTNRVGSTEKAESQINFKSSIALENGLKTLIKYRSM